jgi:hypothetical protein
MNEPETDYSRRTVVGALTALSTLAFLGCRSQPGEEATDAERAGPRTGNATPTAAAMIVYRDPSCGCCTAWADIARQAGYQVTVVDHPDMAAIKRQYGVPHELLSCHTTIVHGYAIEGYVPMEDVQRLLKEPPSGLKGIAVAGMPLGSPGMEVPDGTREPFEVMAFDANGQVTAFNA